MDNQLLTNGTDTYIYSIVQSNNTFTIYSN